jgi:hypothetical protein
MKTLFLFLGIFCFLFARAQPHETYQTEATGSQCPSTLVLYADATYFYEVGCEAQPHLSFGKWTKKKDVLKLETVNPQTFTVINSVTASRVPGDSIWLTILDRDGANMTAKISTGLEVSGRGSYMFANDASATKKYVYKRSGGKIVFRTLNKLFGQRLELATDTANNFVVTLNLLSGWINSVHPDWGNPSSPSLLQKGESLLMTTSSGQRVNFQKQKEEERF